MSRRKRMQNLAEAKDRRMKKIAIGLSVVLVAVLAFEIPKMMHSGGSSATPPPATTTTATPTTGAATTGTATSGTATSGTAVAAVSTTSTKLPNSDAEPQASKSTLYSFSRFADKDPFAQQISATSTTGTTTASAGTTSASSSGTSTSSSTNSSKKQQPSRTLAATGVRISINGAIQTVRIGGTFPSANPLFRLVGASNGIARIAIANGSYASGANTVSLSAGRTLTLVDTADSVRYKIRLLNAS